ncbi:hypothetical protein [uncultured Thiodictyon sp.]|uniref:hypothetical protein n=1 Tax=uncultured Thiodictyon sp. TaxID=1846217 RepID=UPI0025DC02F5|nr:hypothetical protein [uncultured Thiodictyon sp.]
MKKILVQFFVVVGLVGCAFGPTTADLRLKVLGKSKSALVNCMGTPNNSYVSGNMEYMIYSHSETKRNQLYKCDASFALTGDHVTQLDMVGGEEGGNEVTSDFCKNLIMRCFK